MAPSNTYLKDEATRDRLAAHNPKLIQWSMKGHPGDEPETHWDFDRQTESEAMVACLSRFAEPDFTDSKVALHDVIEHAYGYVDDYLTRHTTGMLNPASEFNKKHGNGMVYITTPNGTVRRGSRRDLAFAGLASCLDDVQYREWKTADREQKRIKRAAEKAGRIDPSSKAELQAFSAERQLEIRSGQFGE